MKQMTPTLRFSWGVDTHSETSNQNLRTDRHPQRGKSFRSLFFLPDHPTKTFC
jgi:hypothetical protein